MRSGAPWHKPAQPFLAVLRPLAAARLTMQREMRDISADLMERADFLQRQIASAQVRFQAVMTELKEERATQRLKLETQIQAIHRLINLVSMQHALHRGLKSAVAALDALSAAKVSGTEANKDNGKSPDSQSEERSHEAPRGTTSVGRTDQKVLSKENGQDTT
jgi:hypothetical protein